MCLYFGLCNCMNLHFPCLSICRHLAFPPWSSPFLLRPNIAISDCLLQSLQSEIACSKVWSTNIAIWFTLSGVKLKSLIQGSESDLIQISLPKYCNIKLFAIPPGLTPISNCLLQTIDLLWSYDYHQNAIKMHMILKILSHRVNNLVSNADNVPIPSPQQNKSERKKIKELGLEKLGWGVGGEGCRISQRWELNWFLLVKQCQRWSKVD